MVRQGLASLSVIDCFLEGLEEALIEPDSELFTLFQDMDLAAIQVLFVPWCSVTVSSVHGSFFH